MSFCRIVRMEAFQRFQKFNLNLVKLIKERNLVGLPSQQQQQQQGHWMVLIDAAKGCATERSNLDVYPADFVVCSFYKIFGYPTGLGALIIKKEAASLLNKTCFSEGMVAASIADIDFVQKRKSIEQVLEDGTISFLSITSLRHCFKIIEMQTTSAIARHTSSLAASREELLVASLHQMCQHSNVFLLPSPICHHPTAAVAHHHQSSNLAPQDPTAPS